MKHPDKRSSAAGGFWHGDVAPSLLLLAFLALHLGILSFAWLRQTPSQEEYFGLVARFLNELVSNAEASGGIPWWSINFMEGHPMVDFCLCVVLYGIAT